MRQNLERKARINLYYSPFFPYLIYCNEVWGNASTVHASIDPIIKIQKKSIRTITFSSYLSPFNILNFRKLHGIIQKVSLLMFKISKCDVPKPLYMLYLELITYQTRRSESIDVPIGRTYTKLYIKLLVILVLTYGITYPLIFQQIRLILSLNI